jgi:hypothetical protein
MSSRAPCVGGHLLAMLGPPPLGLAAGCCAATECGARSRVCLPSSLLSAEVTASCALAPPLVILAASRFSVQLCTRTLAHRAFKPTALPARHAAPLIPQLHTSGIGQRERWWRLQRHWCSADSCLPHMWRAASSCREILSGDMQACRSLDATPLPASAHIPVPLLMSVWWDRHLRCWRNGCLAYALLP